jgi:hypothetical protein
MKTMESLQAWKNKSGVKNTLGWLAAEARSPDNWLLILAVINWVHIWSLSKGDCNGVANPWFCDWTWYGAPNRLLLSALCLRIRNRGFAIIGFLCAAHLVAAQLFYLFNPDSIKLAWWLSDEAGEITLQQIFHALLEHELTLGFLAALLVSRAFYRFFRHPSRSRLFTGFKYAAAIGLTILFLGYASNFISHAKAERRTAQWVLHDMIKSSTLYGNCDQQEENFLEESAERFAGVGATVLKMDCGNDFGEKTPQGTVGWSSFPGPFLISVSYTAAASTGIKYSSGDSLILNFFGCTKILQKDSSLHRRMMPYLWPY